MCVKTSNPGSGDLQDLVVDGKKIYERVAAMVDEWSARTVGRHGYGNIGAVVGATYPAAARALRAALPRSLFLMPGVGAQGGSAEAVRIAMGADRVGAIISSSRAILYPSGIAESSSPS